ncbi:hypothetical protein LXA43DRAFT_625848 [Ganoderma leucocontextum]|nr:hypothetical protein LXA43DRAFT_625848 [Ganoderma leucocontextum]
MGCIPSKSKVLEADSLAPIAVKPRTEKEKKQKLGLESPVIAEDAAPWVKGTGQLLSEKDGMMIIADPRPS